MIAPIESSAKRPRKLLEQLLWPDRYLFYLETIVSLCLLILFNGRAFQNFLSSQLGVQITTRDISDVFSEKLSSFFSFFGNSLGGRLPQILVGMLIGSAVYLAFWLINNIATDVRNDIVADSYQHPLSYNRSLYWRFIVTDRLLLVCVVITFLGYLYMFLKLLPVLAKALYIVLQDYSWASGFLEMIAIVAATVILLHGLFVLGRILVNAWRYVFS